MNSLNGHGKPGRKRTHSRNRWLLYCVLYGNVRVMYEPRSSPMAKQENKNCLAPTGGTNHFLIRFPHVA